MLLVSLLMFALACESEPVSPQHSILGDWRVQSCLVSKYVNDVLVDESFLDYSLYTEVIRFMEGGAGAWVLDGAVDGVFAWKLDADNHRLLIIEGIGEVLSYKIQVGAKILLYESESVYNLGTTRTRLVFSYRALRTN